MISETFFFLSPPSKTLAPVVLKSRPRSILGHVLTERLLIRTSNKDRARLGVDTESVKRSSRLAASVSTGNSDAGRHVV